MPNQKLEKAAPLTTLSQFLVLPAVWQQQPKTAKISTKPRISQTYHQMVPSNLQGRIPQPQNRGEGTLITRQLPNLQNFPKSAKTLRVGTS